MLLSLGMQIAAQQRAAFWADPFFSLFKDNGPGAIFNSAVDAANLLTADGSDLAPYDGPVGQVRDTSRGGPSAATSRPRLAQPVLANRPTRVQVDGVAALELNGTNQRLEGNATARDILKGAPGAEFHTAISWAGGFRPLLAISTASANVSRLQLQILATGGLKLFVRRGDGDGFVELDSAAGVITQNVRVIVGASVDYLNGGSEAIKIWANGQVVATAALSGTGNTTDVASAQALIGSNLNASTFFSGLIFREIPITARVLGTAERSAMIARLAALTGVSL